MMEERKIDLIDLITHILYNWKYMFLAALAGALLLGGFSYYKSMQAAPSADYSGMSDEDVRKQLESGLFAFDKLYIEQIVGFESSLESFEDYFDKSVLMTLDPNSVPQAVLIYDIKGKDREESEAVAALYIQLLRSGELAQQIASSDVGLSAAAANELIQVSGAYDSDRSSFLANTYTSSVYYVKDLPSREPSTSFTVTLRNRTPESVTAMADITEEYIKGLPDSSAFAGKNHTCTQVARNEQVVMDAELMEYQKALKDAIYSLNYEKSASFKDSLKGNSLAYYKLLKGESIGGGTATAAAASPSVNRKYVVIGFLTGLFIYAGVMLLIYLMDSRLNYTDDITALYGISRIGSVPDEKKWGRSAYTKWLRKLRDRGNRFFPRDKSVELSCTSIRALAAKKELSSLCVIGCNMEGQTGEICSSIVSAVSEAGIKAESIPNILYDADAYKTFSGYEGVVLLEKAGETMYEEILEELRKISEQGMSLLGAVIVE